MEALLKAKGLLIAIISLLLIQIWFVFLYIPEKITSQVQNATLNEYGAKGLSLKQRIVEYEKKIVNLQENSSDLHEELSVISKSIKSDLAIIRIESGDIVMRAKEIPGLLDPDGCDGDRGLIGRVINFPAPFNSKPKVFLSLVKIDFHSGKDHRLNLEVKDIEKDKFVFDFSVWCDTEISTAKAQWVAFGF